MAHNTRSKSKQNTAVPEEVLSTHVEQPARKKNKDTYDISDDTVIMKDITPLEKSSSSSDIPHVIPIEDNNINNINITTTPETLNDSIRKQDERPKQVKLIEEKINKLSPYSSNIKQVNEIQISNTSNTRRIIFIVSAQSTKRT